MSEDLTLSTIIGKIDSFTIDRDWNKFHSVKNLALSISIEAAELCETIQWDNPSTKDVLSDFDLMTEISEELADVLIYCFRLCSNLNLNPLDIINKKIEKNALRYPVKLSKGKSDKCTKL